MTGAITARGLLVVVLRWGGKIARLDPVLGGNRRRRCPHSRPAGEAPPMVRDGHSLWMPSGICFPTTRGSMAPGKGLDCQAAGRRGCDWALGETCQQQREDCARLEPPPWTQPLALCTRSPYRATQICQLCPP